MPSLSVLRNLLKLRFQSIRLMPSFGVASFYFVLVFVLTIFVSSSMLLRSPEGLQKGLFLIKAQGQLKSLLVSSTNSEEPNNTSSSDQQQSNAPSDIQTQAALAQAQQISKLISPEPVPLSSWLLTMQNHRIVSSPITVYLNPYELSSRQHLLTQVQGIKVLPWSSQTPPPKNINHVSSEIKIWVARPDPTHRVWLVHGSMADLLQENEFEENVVSNLDVIKMILWADELKKQDEWMAQHPTPTPPEDVRPSFVSVSVIPSTSGLLVAFWIAIGFITIFVSSGCLLMGLTLWSSTNQQGEWEAISSLPVPTWVIPTQFVLNCLFKVLPLVLVSCLLSMGLLGIYDVPFFIMDYLKFLLLAGASATLAFSVAVLSQSFFPFAWWRLWVTLILLAFVVMAELSYVVFFANAKIIALLMTSWGFVLIALLWLVASFLCIQYATYRIEKYHRLALRKF